MVERSLNRWSGSDETFFLSFFFFHITTACTSHSNRMPTIHFLNLINNVVRIQTCRFVVFVSQLPVFSAALRPISLEGGNVWSLLSSQRRRRRHWFETFEAMCVVQPARLCVAMV
ncbi:hypothetical protein F5B19DRAFT_102091 [Rostrohypoxylon terebratum]|nr:hypothetical protein F5B19DRAFT_102091 [Rostrohypoxylon terebratum]